MGKGLKILQAKRDDPIFKEGLTVYTPRSPGASTSSTKSSRPGTASPTGPASPSSRPKTQEP